MVILHHFGPFGHKVDEQTLETEGFLRVAVLVQGDFYDLFPKRGPLEVGEVLRVVDADREVEHLVSEAYGQRVQQDLGVFAVVREGLEDSPVEELVVGADEGRLLRVLPQVVADHGLVLLEVVHVAGALLEHLLVVLHVQAHGRVH